MSKTVGILQPSYLPWFGYFEQIYRCDTFVFLDDVQFDKNGWRNRNRILTTQGTSWLTVPVLQKGKTGQKLNEVQIDMNQKWQKKHDSSIKSAYGKGKAFHLYESNLAPLIFEPSPSLCDLNIKIIKRIAKMLKIDREWICSSELNLTQQTDPLERLLLILKEVNGDIFYEGAAGKNYLNSIDFEKEGLELQFQDFTCHPYPQRASTENHFMPYLSIIDCLLWNGVDHTQELLK